MRRAKSRGTVRERWPIFAAPAPLDPKAHYKDEAECEVAERLHAAQTKLAAERADETIDVVLLPTEDLAAHRSQINDHWDAPPDRHDLAWTRRWFELQRELIRASVRAVYGIFVDDREIGAADPNTIIAGLEAAGALPDVTWAALRAQGLTREEMGFRAPSEPTAQDVS